MSTNYDQIPELTPMALRTGASVYAGWAGEDNLRLAVVLDPETTEMVGRLLVDVETGIVHHVRVVPHRRHQGIATMLYRLSGEWLAEDNVSICLSGVRTEAVEIWARTIGALLLAPIPNEGQLDAWEDVVVQMMGTEIKSRRPNKRCSHHYRR